ncbi:hypothetical protein EON65_12380 [archaeon]|nr:MAG: hypothetical protein EON65_12380 [archaeon]
MSSYNSLVQVLIHINRDWTMNGQEVRSRLYYDGILNQLSHYLPPLSSGVKVLVPGAGLGRLAFDTAERGYHVGKRILSL